MAKDSLVANINMDVAPLLWPVEDVLPRGAEHSSLLTAAQDAARRMKMSVSPDPNPEELFFVRSDQYSFVKQGIPSMLLNGGLKSSNPNISKAELVTKWLQTIYHKPQDDMNQALDFESGAKYARYAFLVGYLVAEQNERPTWNRGDFFGEHYAKNKMN